MARKFDSIILECGMKDKQVDIKYEATDHMFEAELDQKTYRDESVKGLIIKLQEAYVAMQTIEGELFIQMKERRSEEFNIQLTMRGFVDLPDEDEPVVYVGDVVCDSELRPKDEDEIKVKSWRRYHKGMAYHYSCVWVRYSEDSRLLALQLRSAFEERKRAIKTTQRAWAALADCVEVKDPYVIFTNEEFAALFKDVPEGPSMITEEVFNKINKRRHELLNKQIVDKLNPREEHELLRCRKQVRDFVNAKHPLPWAKLLQLEETVREKKHKAKEKPASAETIYEMFKLTQ